MPIVSAKAAEIQAQEHIAGFLLLSFSAVAKHCILRLQSNAIDLLNAIGH